MAKAPKTTARPTGTATASGKPRKKQVRKAVKKVDYVPQPDATIVVKFTNTEGVEEEDIIDLVVKEGDNAGKFNAVPEDYDPKIHKPLKRNSFVDEALWFNLVADILEAKAKRMREKAGELKKFGGKDRVKAKKLLAMQKRFEELKKSLAESGLNVDEILASMKPQEEETDVADPSSTEELEAASVSE